MGSSGGEEFRFRQDMKVGTPAAETDNLLKEAFYDTGDLEAISDTSEPESVIVGRTGSGKSALLMQLEQDRPGTTIRINPKATSLQYLAHSTVLPKLQEIGVNLSLFYHKLWQHIIIVELLREHYDIKSEEKQDNWLTSIMSRLGRQDASKAKALEYIGEWDNKFFAEPEERVKRVTHTFEDRVKATLEGKAAAFIEGNLASELSEGAELEEKVRTKSQNVVQKIQIKRLEDMKSLVEEEVLDDPQRPYYILVDDLDKYWINEEFVYDLIRTLLDVASDFAKMDNIKLVIALRRNIVRRIHEEHREPGRQRVKDNALFVEVSWEHNELEGMMDKRVRTLVKGYYGGDVSLDEIVPDHRIQGKRALDYMLERTLKRPRDFISYMNLCIREGVNRGSITWSIIRSVEGEYSRRRVKAVEDEWEENYPGLHDLIEVFVGMEDGFRVEDVDQVKLTTASQRWKQETEESYLGGLAHTIGSSQAGWDEIVGSAVKVLFRVGLVGVRISSGSDIEYVYDAPNLLEFGLREDSIVYFHPATYVALGIRNGEEAA